MEHDERGSDFEDMAEPGHQDETDGVIGAVQKAGRGDGNDPSRAVDRPGEEDEPVEPVDLDDDVRVGMTRAIFEWRGELPMPRDFNAYDKAAQDAILELADRDMRLREKTIDSAIELDLRESNRLDRSEQEIAKQSLVGMLLSFFLDLGIIAGIIVATVFGQPVVASLLAGIGAITIVPSILGRRKANGAQNGDSAGRPSDKG